MEIRLTRAVLACKEGGEVDAVPLVIINPRHLVPQSEVHAQLNGALDLLCEGTRAGASCPCQQARVRVRVRQPASQSIWRLSTPLIILTDGIADVVGRMMICMGRKRRKSDEKMMKGRGADTRERESKRQGIQGARLLKHSQVSAHVSLVR